MTTLSRKTWVSSFNQLQFFPRFFIAFPPTSTHILIKSPKKKFLLFFKYIPQIISLFLIAQYSHDLVRAAFLRPRHVTFYVAVSSLIYANLVLLFESNLNQSAIQSIPQCFDNINEVFSENFNISIEMNSFKKYFRRKVFKVLAFSAVLFLTKEVTVFFRSPGSIFTNRLDLHYVCQTVYRMIAILYLTSFVDLTKVVLEVLNHKFELIRIDLTLRSSVTSARKILNILYHTKVIHFQLYKVSKVISESFGWFLIVYLLCSSVIIINSTFYVYVYASEPDFWDYTAFIRNYHF